MHLYFIYVITIIIYLTNCSKYIQQNLSQTIQKSNTSTSHISSKKQIKSYQEHIHKSSVNYGVDETLIAAIIQVESNYNPIAISKSNAIGLMQVKASAAGKDVYKLKGLTGEPSTEILKNAAINIDFGTAYLSILQKKLLGITNLKTRRYAIIVSYVNGLNTLLNIFSMNHNTAIKKINQLTPDKFYRYIKKNHPESQAPLYLNRVNTAYSSIYQINH